MKYTIVDAQTSDVSEITSAFMDAFKDDPIVGQIWPNVALNVSHAHHARRFAEHFENMERDGTVYRKVVEKESGFVVPIYLRNKPHLDLTRRSKS